MAQEREARLDGALEVGPMLGLTDWEEAVNGISRRITSIYFLEEEVGILVVYRG